MGDEKMTGADLIARERARQIEEEGFDAEHDDEHHGQGDLVRAAICYAMPERLYEAVGTGEGFEFVDPWPWDSSEDKRRVCGTERDGETAQGELPDPESYSTVERLNLLSKAGALIAAEIDRVLREEERVKAALAGAASELTEGSEEKKGD